jgi:hypothetical protein
VFTDALTADYFAPVVRAMCDQPTTTVIVGGSGGSGSAGLSSAGLSSAGLSSAGLGAGGSGAAGLGSAGSGSGSGGSGAAEQVVTAIERSGRRPVLLGASRSTLSLFGAVPREAVSLQTRTDAAVLTGPPAGTWPFSYTVWMASPTPGSSNGAGTTGIGTGTGT